MCDFASFMARIHNNKLEIKRYDWKSHSETCTFHGITLTEKQEWSEVEWTSEDHDSIYVRHTNTEIAIAIKAVIIAEFKNRSVLLKKYSGKVNGINGAYCYTNTKGNYHRENGPAVIYADGTKYWYKNGNYHRKNGPAIIGVNGYKAWYKNGELHREDGPAMIWADGSKEWYNNGKYHRENGPAFIDVNGNKVWYKNGKYHRVNGPAVIWADGTKYWYKNGEPQSAPVPVA